MICARAFRTKKEYASRMRTQVNRESFLILRNGQSRQFGPFLIGFDEWETNADILHVKWTASLLRDSASRDMRSRLSLYVHFLVSPVAITAKLGNL